MPFSEDIYEKLCFLKTFLTVFAPLNVFLYNGMPKKINRDAPNRGGWRTAVKSMGECKIILAKLLIIIKYTPSYKFVKRSLNFHWVKNKTGDPKK